MHWTRNKPTTPWWYWWQREPLKRFDATDVYPGLVYVYEAVGGLFCELNDRRIGKVSVMRGEWSSEPIAEPEEQR